MGFSTKWKERDLAGPITIQNASRIQHFFQLLEMNGYMFGTAPSNAMLLAYYFVRIEPYTTLHLKIHDGHYDALERMFRSFPTFFKTLMNGDEWKEATPEFYCFPEMFLDLNSKKSSKYSESDVSDLLVISNQVNQTNNQNEDDDDEIVDFDADKSKMIYSEDSSSSDETKTEVNEIDEKANSIENKDDNDENKSTASKNDQNSENNKNDDDLSDVNDSSSSSSNNNNNNNRLIRNKEEEDDDDENSINSSNIYKSNIKVKTEEEESAIEDSSEENSSKNDSKIQTTTKTNTKNDEDSSTENSNTKQNSSENNESSNKSNTTEDTENTTENNKDTTNNENDTNNTKNSQNNNDNDDNNNNNDNNNDNDEDQNIHIYQKGDDFQIGNLKTEYSSIVDFVYSNRKMLESEYVSHHLGEWISLLWGDQQGGLFMPYLYSNAWDNNEIAQEAIPTMLENLGSIPPKIFDKRLPKRLLNQGKCQFDKLITVKIPKVKASRNAFIFEKNGLTRVIICFFDGTIQRYSVNFGSKEAEPVYLSPLKLKIPSDAKYVVERETVFVFDEKSERIHCVNFEQLKTVNAKIGSIDFALGGSNFGELITATKSGDVKFWKFPEFVPNPSFQSALNQYRLLQLTNLMVFLFALLMMDF